MAGVSLTDPLNEFAAEDAHGSSPMTFALGDCFTAVRVSPAPRTFDEVPRRLKARWLLASAMLVVGLSAGFVAGIGLAARRWTATPALPPGDTVAMALPSTSAVPAWPRRAETAEPLAARPIPTAQPRPGPGTEQRLESAPPGTPGLVFVESRPAGAQVYLNGELVSTTPFQLSGIQPGRHSIRLQLDGYQPWSAPLAVEPGGRVRVAASLEQSNHNQ